MYSNPAQDDTNYLHNLRHQAVRDLAWCCFSAPLMSELPAAPALILPVDNQSLWPWLHQLDFQPQPLLDHLATLKSTRLGIYYEALWHFYFANHSLWELLEHNLQVDRAGTTLGAFDFLCRNGDQYWHIETAVKFYLSRTPNAPEAYEWKHWIGPEGRDRLDLKLNHLCERQLPLHQTQEGKSLLKELYPQAKCWNTGLCLQGYLFSPAAGFYKPAFSNPHHAQGNWHFASNFLAELELHPQRLWKIMERHKWLSPALETDPQLMLSSTQIANYIKDELRKGFRPQLLAEMTEYTKIDTNQKKYTIWFEKQRLFVLPNTWPN